MAKFAAVPIGELEEKLSGEQGERLTREKRDDPKDLRKALRAAATSQEGHLGSTLRGSEGSDRTAKGGQPEAKRRSGGGDGRDRPPPSDW
jgi:hypothetical protein